MMDGNEDSVMEAVSANEGATWNLLNVSTFSASLSNSEQYLGPELLRDPNDGLHAVWVLDNSSGTGVFGGDVISIFYSSRSLSSSWATPMVVATMSVIDFPIVSAAIDSSGTIQMVYGNDLHDSGGGNGGERLWYISKSSGGIWTQPAILWSETSAPTTAVATVVNKQNQFVVALATVNILSNTENLAFDTLSAGTWSGWDTVWTAVPGGSGFPPPLEAAMAVGSNNSLHVLLMLNFDSDLDSTDLLYLSNSGGTWQQDGQWLNANRPYQANIAVDNQNKVHVIWSGATEVPGPLTLYDLDTQRLYATDDASGSWSPVQEIRALGWNLGAGTFGFNPGQSAIDMTALNWSATTGDRGNGRLSYFKLPMAFSTYLSDLAPPSGLMATPLNQDRIQLNWQPSISTATTSLYSIYWDSGTGILSDAHLLAMVSSSSFQYVTQPLVSGDTYYFVVRAVNSSCFENTDDSNKASAVAVDTVSADVSAEIETPQAGLKIDGDRVTVEGNLIRGGDAEVGGILFQYRASTVAPWIDISPTELDHPNPATEPPYFVHWDVTGLAAGDYELQAAATSVSNVSDPSPPGIFVTVDHNAADLNFDETAYGNGIQKVQSVYGSVTNTIAVGDVQPGVSAQISLPSGALGVSSTTLTVLTAPTGTPAIPSALASSGIFLKITLGSGQTQLLGGQTAAVTVSYPDTDNNGIVDGTQAQADKLALYAYDAGSGTWERLPTTLDTADKTITGQTPHFSYFGLLAAAPPTLSNVEVYPDPWVPNDGKADDGKPYSPGDPTSGIVFDNLTQSVKIQIYTVTGELVWDCSTQSSSGKIQWDGRNNAGREAASGGYLAVITDTATGAKAVRKIAIIR